MPSSLTSTWSTPVPDHGIHGTFACCATIVDEILSPSDRIADPGGPMKTIFLCEAARDSGSLGFSEACPLFENQYSATFAHHHSIFKLTIRPRRHVRPYAQQHLRSIQHWRSCCCLFLQGPQRIDLPFG